MSCLFDRQKNGKKKKIEWIILNKILELRKIQGKAKKFVGALTTELIRTELLKHRFNVSNRDVFIEGIPNELDLLIVKADKNPKENILYSPDDILVVFEIKFRGTYGENQRNSIKKIFDNIKRKNKNIECFYITISENIKYRHRVISENLGYDCFELLTRESGLETALKKKLLKTTGDWDKLLNRLHSIIPS